MSDMNLIGKVDLIGPEFVVGWAIVQSGGEDLFPKLLLTCDGEVVSETSQPVFRGDLQDLHGFGGCGFSIAIPSTIKSKSLATLAVVEEASGEVIDASCAKVTLPCGGGIEHSSHSLITGYVFDTRTRLTLPRVGLVRNGEAVAVCMPSSVRRDMQRVLGTDQVWQFALQVPPLPGLDIATYAVEFEGEPGVVHPVAQNARSRTVARLATAYFDDAWYRSYRELADCDFSSMTALEHFLAIGYYQGLSPTPLFDAEWYAGVVPGLSEAIAAGQFVSAFQHYADHGVASSSDPHPLISHEYLRTVAAGFTHDANTGIIAAILDGRLAVEVVNPLVSDAAKYGACEITDWCSHAVRQPAEFRLQSAAYLYFVMARDRSPPAPRYFDSAWYAARNAVAGSDDKSGFRALSHYFRTGRQNGADPHPLVSTTFFARRCGSINLELTAQGGLLSILLASDPAAVGLNPFIYAGFDFQRGRACDASPYIDDEWYFENNPRARRALELGLVGSATEHLTRAADHEIDVPHPLFAREWYLTTYPVAAAAISVGGSLNAFAYFIEFGQHIGHDPHPAFDSAWYLGRWIAPTGPETDGSMRALTAFEHFHLIGAHQDHFPSAYFWIETEVGLYREAVSAPSRTIKTSPRSRFEEFANAWDSRDFRPNALFDPEYYAECARELGIDLGQTENVFSHYLRIGVYQGIEPNAFFNSIWYLRCYLADDADAAMAFKHYCTIGLRNGYSPNPLFDENYYINTYLDIKEKIDNKQITSGFTHYCSHGYSENRRTHPYLLLENAPKLNVNGAGSARGDLHGYLAQVKAGVEIVPDIGRLFSETWYTTAYPETIGEMAFFNLPTGFAHYIHIGTHRLRSPGPLFDEAFYLRANRDLSSALAKNEIASGYSHFCRAKAEDRAWHPLLSFKTLLHTGTGSDVHNPEPSALQRRLEAAPPTVPTTTFTTLAAEFEYWSSVCASNPANYWAVMQLVGCTAQLNDVETIRQWLPLAKAGRLEPWRALSLSVIERCFALGDHGFEQASFAFASLHRNTPPTFIVEKPLPREIICGRATAIAIDCVCFHPLHDMVEIELCIGDRSFLLSPNRVIRPNIYEQYRDSDLLGHSLYSGLNDHVVVDDHPPGTTASVSYRLRVRDAFGADHISLIPAGEVSFLPPGAASQRPNAIGQQRRIAICMATFRPDLELFARQLDSIRLQHNSAWTLFISDDASGPEAVRGMMREIGDDQRIVLHSNRERVGFCKNFERAIRLAGPDFDAFALCDQDDEWFSDKLTVLDAALQDGVMLAYSDMEVCSRDRETLSKSFWTSRANYWEDINDVLVANSVTGAACLFDRRVLELAMPFPDVSGLYHDHWLALCSMALGRIEFIPTPLHRYVQHEQNVLGFVSSVQSSFKLEHFRRRYLEIRKLSRKPAAELTRIDLSALINAGAIHREIIRLQAIVATLVRRAAMSEGGDLIRAAHFIDRRSSDGLHPSYGATGRMGATHRGSLPALWMQDGRFPTATALAHIRRQGDAGVRKTLGAEFRLATSVMATDALQRGKTAVVRHVLRLDATDLRAKIVREDASLRTLSTTNAVTWRDHLRSKIRPLVFSRDAAAEPSLRVNFLVPELTLSVFFGGYLGKFHLIRKLVHLGLPVRVITLDHYAQDIATIAGIEKKYPEFVGLFSQIEVVDRYDRSESLPIHDKDVFIATTWWSAHVAEDARRRTNKAAFFYLIQEFEPFTFAMGSWYATAMESYSFPHRALFSTDLLQEYFQIEKIGVFDPSAAGKASSCSFSNAIVDGSQYAAAPATGKVGRKAVRRLLFYARPEPHASRNMFEMGIASLIVAIQQGVFPLDEWEFIGIGSASADFGLHGGAVLRMIGKMGLDEYYRFLQTVDVGLALMFTPHPSLVPLDMASFGVATVTNTCMNKNEAALRAISPNILPTPPTIAGIVGGLEAARDLAHTQPRPERVGQVKWAMSWDQALNPGVMEFVARSLQELGQGEPPAPAADPAPARVRKAPRPKPGARGRSG